MRFNASGTRGVDVNLVIVGRLGWSMESTRRLIEASREHRKRLFWIGDASDEYLELLYGASTALISASEAEGFGLPLIEAAVRGLPLIVRDIPVFREVAGDHAYYFVAENETDLARAISDWLELSERGDAPQSSGLQVLRWSESVEQFQTAMFGNGSYGLNRAIIDRIRPDPAHGAGRSRYAAGATGHHSGPDGGQAGIALYRRRLRIWPAAGWRLRTSYDCERPVCEAEAGARH